MSECKNGRKRLLSLDGGGIRGVLGILASIEELVGRPLCEYFDYIAGTSTGAIIAAGLAKGMTVAELQEFYTNFGPQMFEQRFLLQRYKSLYTSDPLQKQLKITFGAETTLGSADITPLLLIVTRNWTTDSPWPVSSNKCAVYNNVAFPYCNLQIPLWQLVRASTAAPVYFPPEVLRWDPKDDTKTFVFVDGGVTPYNNPAFLLYRMATAPEYCLEWPTGEDKMLIISVGTGSAPKTGPTFQTRPVDPYPNSRINIRAHVRRGSGSGRELSHSWPLHLWQPDRPRSRRYDPSCPPASRNLSIIRGKASTARSPTQRRLGKSFLVCALQP